MRILFRKTATKTAELYVAKGKHATGIEILKKLIAEDATDEHIHRLLMRYYAETASKHQALKQFEQCRAALHNLGIEPEPETLKLEQIIKRGEMLPLTNGHKPATAKSTVPIVSTPRIKQLTFQTVSSDRHFFYRTAKRLFSAQYGTARLPDFTLCGSKPMNLIV